MTRASEDWARLASYVISARLAAGYKDRRALAEASGVTERTLGKLENGQRVGPETLAAVEALVGWNPDSARRILGGGEPVPVAAPESQRPARDPRDILAPLSDEEYESLTPDERAIARSYLETLRHLAAQRAAERRREGA